MFKNKKVNDNPLVNEGRRSDLSSQDHATSGLNEANTTSSINTETQPVGAMNAQMPAVKRPSFFEKFAKGLGFAIIGIVGLAILGGILSAVLPATSYDTAEYTTQTQTLKIDSGDVSGNAFTIDLPKEIKYQTNLIDGNIEPSQVNFTDREGNNLWEDSTVSVFVEDIAIDGYGPETAGDYVPDLLADNTVLTEYTETLLDYSLNLDNVVIDTLSSHTTPYSDQGAIAYYSGEHDDDINGDVKGIYYYVVDEDGVGYNILLASSDKVYDENEAALLEVINSFEPSTPAAKKAEQQRS